MGLIIILARQLGDRNNEMHQGNWQKVWNIWWLFFIIWLNFYYSFIHYQKSVNCFEIRGKTLGIIGYGHVGSVVGIMAEFFGMRVVWYDHQPLMPIGNRYFLSFFFSSSSFLTNFLLIFLLLLLQCPSWFSWWTFRTSRFYFYSYPRYTR